MVDLPTVKELDLEYRFPAYTGLAPRSGQTAATWPRIRGTDVVLHVVPTMTTPERPHHLERRQRGAAHARRPTER